MNAAIVRLVTALAIMAAPAVVHAEALPRAGRVDPRVREVIYNRDNVTAIDATFGTSTLIELQPDEKIETLALGDSVAWRVEPNRKGDIIFVKPVEKDAHSNLNVVTDRRIYSFVLRSNTRPPGQQLYIVRFRFPDDEADARLLAAARERAAFPNLKDLNIANANSAYGYKGSSANKPVAVFDDGTKTWFRFAGETPAIFIVDGERNESLVNFRTEGPFVVVDKVSAQWTLRNGDDSTCIFNRRTTNLHVPTALSPMRRSGLEPPPPWPEADEPCRRRRSTAISNSRLHPPRPSAVAARASESSLGSASPLVRWHSPDG